MAGEANDQALNRYARLTGLVYVVATPLWIGVLFLTTQIAGTGDFATIAKNIHASEHLYRAGLAAQVVADLSTLLLAGAFYALVKPVSPHVALIAFGSRAAESVLFAILALLYFIALNIYTGAAGGFDAAGQQALLTLVSRAQIALGRIASIYYAIGSGLFFYLLFKARFIPRAVSFLGVFAAVATFFASIWGMIAPTYLHEIGLYAGYSQLAGEVLTGLWLLIAGADLKYWKGRKESLSAA